MKSSLQLMISLALQLGALLMIGCAKVEHIDQDGNQVTHHFGYVKQVEAKQDGQAEETYSTRTETYGVRIRDGLTVGYESNERTSVSMDCRLTVVVGSQQELDQLMPVLAELGGGSELCAIVAPD